MLCSFMGGVSFPGVPAPVVRWLRTEGYTAFSSFTHLLTLPPNCSVKMSPHGDMGVICERDIRNAGVR